MTGLVDEGRAVGSVYLDFSMSFDTVSSKAVPEKLMKYKQDEQIVRWLKTGWLARPRAWWSVAQSLARDQ